MMPDLALPALAATSVGLFAYGAAQLAAALFDPDRKKLAARLSGVESGGGPTSLNAAAVRLTYDDGEDAKGALARLAARSPFLRDLRKQVIQAYPDATLEKFLLIAAGAGVATFMVFTVITATFLVGLIAGGLGFGAPFLLLSHKRAGRQRALTDQIPDALDFLSRSLKAGHSLSIGLQMMGDELPQPLASEFRRTYDQHSLGLPLETALREMVERIDSTDFAFFVTAVLIQRQTGGDLSEVLGNISGMIRQRVRLQQHVKAKTAEGRFTGYILAAFPAVMFVVAYTLNPKYAGPLVHTNTGLMMLGTALTMQLLGLFFIKKLTKVAV